MLLTFVSTVFDILLTFFTHTHTLSLTQIPSDLRIHIQFYRFQVAYKCYGVEQELKLKHQPIQTTYVCHHLLLWVGISLPLHLVGRNQPTHTQTETLVHKYNLVRLQLNHKTFKSPLAKPKFSTSQRLFLHLVFQLYKKRITVSVL